MLGAMVPLFTLYIEADNAQPDMASMARLVLQTQENSPRRVAEIEDISWLGFTQNPPAVFERNLNQGAIAEIFFLNDTRDQIVLVEFNGTQASIRSATDLPDPISLQVFQAAQVSQQGTSKTLTIGNRQINNIQGTKPNSQQRGDSTRSNTQSDTPPSLLFSIVELENNRLVISVLILLGTVLIFRVLGLRLCKMEATEPANTRLE
jgi:hypothetical protein